MGVCEKFDCGLIDLLQMRVEMGLDSISSLLSIVFVLQLLLSNNLETSSDLLNFLDPLPPYCFGTAFGLQHCYIEEMMMLFIIVRVIIWKWITLASSWVGYDNCNNSALFFLPESYSSTFRYYVAVFLQECINFKSIGWMW